MLYLKKNRKRLLLLANSRKMRWRLILGFTLASLLISGCDFIDQLGSLGGNVGDMIGRGIGGG